LEIRPILMPLLSPLCGWFAFTKIKTTTITGILNRLATSSMVSKLGAANQPLSVTSR
jgi:hypothetical protein